MSRYFYTISYSSQNKNLTSVTCAGLNTDKTKYTTQVYRHLTEQSSLYHSKFYAMFSSAQIIQQQARREVDHE